MQNNRDDASVWIEEEVKSLLEFDKNDAIYTGVEASFIEKNEAYDIYDVKVNLMRQVDVVFKIFVNEDKEFYTEDLIEDGAKETIQAAELAAEMFYELIFQKEVLYKALFNEEGE